MRVITVALLFIFILLTGCQQKVIKTEKKKAETEYEIVKEYKKGPVTFYVKVSQSELTIADHIELVLETKAKEDFQVKLPDFGEKLEQFGIVDYRSSPPRLIEDKMMFTRKFYELEPFLSGEYKIPSMKVTFHKKGDKENIHELESEEIKINVKSIFPEGTKELVLKEIKPPVTLPQPDRKWLYLSAALVTAFSGGIVFLLIWRRRREKGEVFIRRPAHEIAYELLERLLAEKLIDKGEIKLFYFHLSNILRHYIENRFALKAPEQTTEEFLADLQFTDVLPLKHKSLLKNFLQHCDSVKFAKYKPSEEEIQKTFDSCKQFIVETHEETEIKT